MAMAIFARAIALCEEISFQSLVKACYFGRDGISARIKVGERSLKALDIMTRSRRSCRAGFAA